MLNGTREQLLQIAMEPERYEKTVAYLAENMKSFLRGSERVLLCFSDEPGSVGAMLGRAVRALGAEPLFWGPDYSWQALLRQAFFSRPGMLIGPPLVVLGLTKVARQTSTPLTIRNVLLAGAASEQWMIEGIRQGLDANICGCFDPMPGAIVCGFACPDHGGVHVWEDMISVELVDSKEQVLPGEQLGEVAVSFRDRADVTCRTGIMARCIRGSCSCGSHAARLTDFAQMKEPDPTLDGLQEHLLTWTSVLDYRAVRTEMGLELEVIAFPGQRLPTIPSCARRVVRPWIPKHDVPFYVR